MATVEITVGSDDPTPLVRHRRIIRCLRRKSGNGSKRLVRLGGPFKRLTPAIFGVAGVQRDPRHIEEHLQANQRANLSHL